MKKKLSTEAEKPALNKGAVISRFSLTKDECDLYFHLLKVTKSKPHNITKGIAYQRALVLESKGLCKIIDYGNRVDLWAIQNGL